MTNLRDKTCTWTHTLMTPTEKGMLPLEDALAPVDNRQAGTAEIVEPAADSACSTFSAHGFCPPELGLCRSRTRPERDQKSKCHIPSKVFLGRLWIVLCISVIPLQHTGWRLTRGQRYVFLRAGITKDCTVNFSYSFKHTVSTKDVWYKGITKIYHMKKGTPITICWFFGWGAKI